MSVVPVVTSRSDTYLPHPYLKNPWIHITSQHFYQFSVGRTSGPSLILHKSQRTRTTYSLKTSPYLNTDNCCFYPTAVLHSTQITSQLGREVQIPFALRSLHLSFPPAPPHSQSRSSPWERAGPKHYQRLPLTSSFSLSSHHSPGCHLLCDKKLPLERSQCTSFLPHGW